MKSWLTLSIAMLLPSSAFAQPVLETFDRFEMNWSNMRVRYYGEAPSDPKQGGYEVAEKTATNQGLLYALSTVPTIRSEKGLSNASASKIAESVTKQSYVFNTLYFSDGRVRVELSSSLATALDPGTASFAAEAPAAPNAQASAIIVEVASVKTPGIIKEIRSGDGDTLFSSSDIARSAYQKQLTGRWFYAGSSELKDFTGPAPVRLRGVLKDGYIQVNKADWLSAREGNERLLQEAKVAYVLPTGAG